LTFSQFCAFNAVTIEAANMAKNWIAGAIKHPGALHRELGVPKGKKIPKAKLAKAAKAGGKEGQRARLAITLSKLRAGK
jgi:hypothetical protein